MAINKVEYGGDTLMDITDTTALVTDVASGKFFYTADGVKREGTKILKIDSGTFELDADSSSYTITGITDSNGNSFTPNVIVFIMSDASAATTHNLGSHKVVAFMRRKSEISARIATYQMTVSGEVVYKDIVRTNPSITGITWGNGTVRYSTSNSVYYLAKGTYAWIALREE